VSLGLDLASDDGHGLIIVAVASGGAANAWNKQCRSEARQILPGDRLLSVNAADTEKGMREEAQSKLLLRLTLQRGPGHTAGQSSAAAAWHPWFGGMADMMPYVKPWPVQEELVESFCNRATGGAEPWAWQWSASGAAGVQVSADTRGTSVVASRGPSCRFEWVEEATRLCGKGTCLTKAQQLECGEFAFTIHAEQTSDKRGGSSFQSSKGRGSVHVKCNSSNVGEVEVMVSLANEGGSCTVMHDFAGDSICKVPRVFDFSTAVDTTQSTFAVVVALAQVKR